MERPRIKICWASQGARSGRPPVHAGLGLGGAWARRHHQRRAEALARDIADRNGGEVLLGKADKEVEIAANPQGWDGAATDQDLLGTPGRAVGQQPQLNL